MAKPRFTETVVHRNYKGKIVEIKDTVWGGAIYILCDKKGKYVKDIPTPFKIEDYL